MSHQPRPRNPLLLRIPRLPVSQPPHLHRLLKHQRRRQRFSLQLGPLKERHPRPPLQRHLLRPLRLPRAPQKFLPLPALRKDQRRPLPQSSQSPQPTFWQPRGPPRGEQPLRPHLPQKHRQQAPQRPPHQPLPPRPSKIVPTSKRWWRLSKRHMKESLPSFPNLLQHFPNSRRKTKGSPAARRFRGLLPF